MTTIVIGKRHIPLEHVALVEPFDPSLHPGIKTEKAFKARLVLIDRQSVLTEETVEAFAAAHRFRVIEGDGVAASPDVRFAVESFVPADGFQPTKDFLTRLTWRDLDGDTQSKLLLSRPEDVLAVAVTGESKPGPTQPRLAAAGSRKPTASIDRRKARRAKVPTPL